jgi:hypothetical protein
VGRLLQAPEGRGPVSLPTLTEYRQSTLRALEVCPRRTRFALETGDLITGWTGGSTTLGAIFHEFVFDYMETLKKPRGTGRRSGWLPRRR